MSRDHHDGPIAVAAPHMQMPSSMGVLEEEVPSSHASTSKPAAQVIPPTSPTYGYFHPISQNIMFTAPPGSRFVLAPNATLSVTIFQARNLQLEGTNKLNPFVRAVQGDFKYMTSTARSEHPVWNETFKFPILSPVRELLILELHDDKAFGKTLLGYLPLDLSLLPRGVEVVTWEKLSHSQGEISIGLTANGFGLEVLPEGYHRMYEEWRTTIPSVSKENQPSSKKGSSPTAEPQGPYGHKNVPQGYIVENGNVKRVPSAVSKALGKAKGLFAGRAAR